MAGKTAYLERKLLDHSLGKTSYTMPAVWVGLFTAAPSDAGGGTEVSGGSYARKSTAAADWSAAATVSGVSSSSNANAVTFVTATASWGTATHFGLFDAATAGNLLRWAPLTTAKAVASGDTPSFAAGSLTITED
jgi:hypothetical protein